MLKNASRINLTRKKMSGRNVRRRSTEGEKGEESKGKKIRKCKEFK
jgi:hypothetical protein